LAQNFTGTGKFQNSLSCHPKLEKANFKYEESRRATPQHMVGWYKYEDNFTVHPAEEES
jgi:hypothetical protein